MKTFVAVAAFVLDMVLIAGMIIMIAQGKLEHAILFAVLRLWYKPHWYKSIKENRP